MPFYDFANDKTGEVKTLFFHMNDEKKYVDECGFEWRRVFESVNASIDTKIDPYDSRDFVEKTRHKKGTLGSIWDKSKELSEKRKGNSNHDPVKEQTYKNYENKVKKPHINKVREQAAASLKSMGVTVS